MHEVRTLPLFVESPLFKVIVHRDDCQVNCVIIAFRPLFKLFLWLRFPPNTSGVAPDYTLGERAVVISNFFPREFHGILSVALARGPVTDECDVCGPDLQECVPFDIL